MSACRKRKNLKSTWTKYQPEGPGAVLRSWPFPPPSAASRRCLPPFPRPFRSLGYKCQQSAFTYWTHTPSCTGATTPCPSSPPPKVRRWVRFTVSCACCSRSCASASPIISPFVSIPAAGLSATTFFRSTRPTVPRPSRGCWASSIPPATW